MSGMGSSNIIGNHDPMVDFPRWGKHSSQERRSISRDALEICSRDLRKPLVLGGSPTSTNSSPFHVAYLLWMEMNPSDFIQLESEKRKSLPFVQRPKTLKCWKVRKEQ
jgi:hypothetical protein